VTTAAVKYSSVEGMIQNQYPNAEIQVRFISTVKAVVGTLKKANIGGFIMDPLPYFDF